MKTDRKSVMAMAWQMVNANGYSFSDALSRAWLNARLKSRMNDGIVKFWFQKVNGEVREAYGTLKADLLPPIKGNGSKPNPFVQVYYDTEKESWRSFKVANLVKVG